jgi:hypothetical protein
MEGQQGASMEKCAKCEKELGFRKMHVNDHINEWLCTECEELFSKEFEIFKTDFLQPERSKREDQRCTFCLNPESILTPETCCTGCGALNSMNK